MGVFCLKVDSGETVLAVESRTCSFGPEGYFKINSVVDDNMESILEFLNFVSIANYVNLTLIVWLKHSVPLNDLPDALLVFCEGGVLSRNLRLILDSKFLSLVCKHLHAAVIKLISISLYKRTC